MVTSAGPRPRYLEEWDFLALANPVCFREGDAAYLNCGVEFGTAQFQIVGDTSQVERT